MRFVIALTAMCVLVAGCATKTMVITSRPADDASDSITKSKEIVAANHLEQGKQLYAAGKHEQAIKHFVRCIATDNQNWEAYYYLGLTQQKQSRFDRAIGSLNSSLKFAPPNDQVRAGIFYALGVSWENEGYLDKAHNYYKEANRLDPKLSNAQTALERIETKRLKADTDKKTKTRGSKAY